MPINPLGYSCIKKLQRDNLWHAYNEPINFYSVDFNFNQFWNFCFQRQLFRIHCQDRPSYQPTGSMEVKYQIEIIFIKSSFPNQNWWFKGFSCEGGGKYRPDSWVRNICFFSPLIPSKREKNILVLLSLYIFWGKCVYFSIFEW